MNDLAYRADPSTGVLSPLEQIKEKTQSAGSRSEYRYLEGVQSSVSLPTNEAFQFVIRVDGDSRTLKDRHILCHFLERLEQSDGKRYRTKSHVKLEQTFDDVVFGLDPKKPKNGTLRISLRAPAALAAGEYAVTLDSCGGESFRGPQYGAFRALGAGH